MKTDMKILVVDDEQDICEILQYNLESEGYDVDTAYSAEEAMQLTLSDYSLILLDVMMGEISGFQMARIMKAHPSTASIPIIFTTALDGEDNMVKGLNIGADDYIAKPLSMKEVKARVKAVLRRTAAMPATADAPVCIECEGLSLNTANKTLLVDGNDVPVTKIEYELLYLFVTNTGRVFSREDLLRRCWPSDTIVLDRTVDVNITRLRKKIGSYGRMIKTRIGYGYTFEL